MYNYISSESVLKSYNQVHVGWGSCRCCTRIRNEKMFSLILYSAYWGIIVMLLQLHIVPKLLQQPCPRCMGGIPCYLFIYGF